MPLEFGLDPDGNNRPVTVSRRGVLASDRRQLAELLAEQLLEMRAVRIGLEMLNDMQPGDLIDMAREEE